VRIPGLKRVRYSALWLRSRWAPGALVLGYHRIAEPAGDEFGLCVSPQHFAEQLEVIRALATPLRLSNLVRCATSARLPEAAVAITFDDGYADVVEHALPRLREAEVPATIFVISGLLGTEFWWERLLHAFAPTERTYAAPDGGPDLDSMHLRLRSLPSGERERELLTLETRAAAVATDLPRSLTADELRMLGGDPLVEIGAHTRSHPWLPSLSVAEQRAEIRGCRRELEDIVGARVSGFSYPYGGESPALRNEVRAAG
jgi:peptidoglycan/xylan/chitin deacetylase (PgdA/CDA1 family)